MERHSQIQGGVEAGAQGVPGKGALALVRMQLIKEHKVQEGQGQGQGQGKGQGQGEEEGSGRAGGVGVRDILRILR